MVKDFYGNYVLYVDSFDNDLSNSFNLKQIKETLPDAPLHIRINMQNWRDEDYKEIQKLALIAKDAGFNVSVKIDANDRDVLVEELKKWSEVEEKLKVFGVGVSYFEDADYSIKEVAEANSKINSIIEKINATNASPMEKFLMAYRYVTSRRYKENNENKSSSRDFISVMNSDDIVCVGYAKLLKRICDGIGVKCVCQAVAVESENDITYHKNNLVYMKDEKYGISGWYYVDACWDSQKQELEKGRKYSFCLIPLSDKNQLKNETVIPEKEFEIFYKKIPVAELEFSHRLGILMSQLDMRDASQDIWNDCFNKFSNPENMVNACEKLKKVLKKAEVPANVYDGNLYVPEHLSCDYMLAMLMAEDCVGFNRSVNDLRRVLSGHNARVSTDKFYIGAIPDVYKRIDEIKNKKFNSGRLITDEIKNDPYAMGKEKELAEDIEKEDKKYERLKDYIFSMPSMWRDIDRFYHNNLLAKLIKIKTDKYFDPGEPIDEETMRRAIVESLILEGKSKGEAHYESAVSMCHTKSYSELFFTEKAKNCFAPSLENKTLEK